jgi:hypothetical protein
MRFVISQQVTLVTSAAALHAIHVLGQQGDMSGPDSPGVASLDDVSTLSASANPATLCVVNSAPS